MPKRGATPFRGIPGVKINMEIMIQQTNNILSSASERLWYLQRSIQ